MSFTNCYIHIFSSWAADRFNRFSSVQFNDIGHRKQQKSEHHIFALTYWAHRAVVLAIAWFPCLCCLA